MKTLVGFFGVVLLLVSAGQAAADLPVFDNDVDRVRYLLDLQAILLAPEPIPNPTLNITAETGTNFNTLVSLYNKLGPNYVRFGAEVLRVAGQVEDPHLAGLFAQTVRPAIEGLKHTAEWAAISYQGHEGAVRKVQVNAIHPLSNLEKMWAQWMQIVRTRLNLDGPTDRDVAIRAIMENPRLYPEGILAEIHRLEISLAHARESSNFQTAAIEAELQKLQSALVFAQANLLYTQEAQLDADGQVLASERRADEIRAGAEAVIAELRALYAQTEFGQRSTTIGGIVISNDINNTAEVLGFQNFLSMQIEAVLGEHSGQQNASGEGVLSPNIRVEVLLTDVKRIARWGMGRTIGLKGKMHLAVHVQMGSLQNTTTIRTTKPISIRYKRGEMTSGSVSDIVAFIKKKVAPEVPSVAKRFSTMEGVQAAADSCVARLIAIANGAPAEATPAPALPDEPLRAAAQ